MSEEEIRRLAWLHLLQGYKIVIGDMEQALAANTPLSLVEFELIFRLGRAEDNKLGLLDLSHMLLVTRSGVTRLLDRLEQAGYVSRLVSDVDRRVVYATLTDDGRSVLDESTPTFFDALDAVFARHFSDTEAVQLNNLLLKLIEGNGRSSVSPYAAEIDV